MSWQVCLHHCAWKLLAHMWKEKEKNHRQVAMRNNHCALLSIMAYGWRNIQHQTITMYIVHSWFACHRQSECSHMCNNGGIFFNLHDHQHQHHLFPEPPIECCVCMSECMHTQYPYGILVESMTLFSYCHSTVCLPSFLSFNFALTYEN